MSKIVVQYTMSYPLRHSGFMHYIKYKQYLLLGKNYIKYYDAGQFSSKLNEEYI